MAKTINLSNVIKHATPATPKRTKHAKRGQQVTGRRNTGGGIKKHGHEASRVICNRNLWHAGQGIIWTTV